MPFTDVSIFFLYKILWSDFMVFVLFFWSHAAVMKISIATNPEPFLNWNFVTQCWIKKQVLEKERLIVVVVVVCFTLHFTCTWSAISQEFTNVRVFFFYHLFYVLLSHLKSFKIAFAHYFYWFNLYVEFFSERLQVAMRLFFCLHFWSSCHQIIFTETS